MRTITLVITHVYIFLLYLTIIFTHVYIYNTAISNDEKKTIKSFQVGMTGSVAGASTQQQSSYEIANRLWDMIAEDVV